MGMSILIMFESEGSCPVCGNSMGKGTRSLSVGGRSYWMPYSIYCCWHHGYFMWRGRKHNIITLKLLESEATKIEELPPEVPYLDSSEIIPVKMKCKYCGLEWRMHSGFLRIGEKIWCPQHHELDAETAVVGEMPIVKRWRAPTSRIAILQYFKAYKSVKDLAEALKKDGYKIDEDTAIKVLKSEWEKGNFDVTYTAKTLDDLTEVLKVSRDRLHSL